MNKELTNEAAELIGQYVKGGKKTILDIILKNGGIVKKSIENSDRTPEMQKTLYYYQNGAYIVYDPIRAKNSKKSLKE